MNIQNITKILLIFFQYNKILLSSLISYIYGLITKEKSINNEVVLVTGSGGYLGRYLCLELAKRNCKLVLWDINEQENSKIVKRLVLNGFTNFIYNTVDITDRNQIKINSKKIKEKFGDVTMVFMCSAPSFKPTKILDLKDEEVNEHFKINYLSQLWLMQEFIIPMMLKNHGHFITISSITAQQDMPYISLYSSFKSAQSKLLECLREEMEINQTTQVRTSLVYLGILNGGLADSFKNVFDLKPSFYLDGKEASKLIVSDVLKNKEIIYIPKHQWWFSFIKYAFSGRFLSKLASTEIKIKHI